jgi:hypothetical protein
MKASQGSLGFSSIMMVIAMNADRTAPATAITPLLPTECLGLSVFVSAIASSPLAIAVNTVS